MPQLGHDLFPVRLELQRLLIPPHSLRVFPRGLKRCSEIGRARGSGGLKTLRVLMALDRLFENPLPAQDAAQNRPSLDLPRLQTHGLCERLHGFDPLAELLKYDPELLPHQTAAGLGAERRFDQLSRVRPFGFRCQLRHRCND